jgi:hypothetical protein
MGGTCRGERIVRIIHPLHVARSGGWLRLSKIVPDKICVEPERFSSGLSSLSATHKKSPRGLYRLRKEREGLFGPSLGLTLRAARPRGQPSVRHKFVPDKFVSNRKVLIGPLSAHKKSPCGLCRSRNGKEGLLGPSLGLTPPRCALRGQPFGCPNLFQTNLSNRKGSHQGLSLRHP